jgi:uncharacterized protein YjlB
MEEARMQPFARSFAEPDDTTRFPNGYEQVIAVRGAPVGMATFQPGWRWSNDVRPLFATESCPVTHVGYLLSGRLHVEMNDGSTLDVGRGDVYVIPAGHDAWVVGDEPCTLLDWGGKVRGDSYPVDEAIGATR